MLRRMKSKSKRYNPALDPAMRPISAWWQASTDLTCDKCGEDTVAAFLLQEQTKFDNDLLEGQYKCACGEGTLARKKPASLLIAATAKEIHAYNR